MAGAVCLLVMTLLVLAIGGMSARLVEASKETHTSSSGITTVKGSSAPMVTAAAIHVQRPLYEAFAASADELDAVKAVRLPSTDTYATALSFTIVGWSRGTTEVTFFTARGDTIEVSKSEDVIVRSSSTGCDHAGPTVSISIHTRI